MPTSLAVVIPTRNEAGQIGKTLASLRQQTRLADQIILADASSTDDTIKIARELGASVVDCPKRGRGHQIRHALMQCSHEVIVIAHADMVFPANALQTIVDYLDQHPACPGGCLGHHFDRKTIPLRMVEGWDFLRARWFGQSYGDQCQFVRRTVLEPDGFPDQPLMEDVELARMLVRRGSPVYLNQQVVTSARRFAKLGYWRTVWLNLQLRKRYRRGGKAIAQQLFDEYYG